MVDFPAYRRAEIEAMGRIQNWRDMQAHRPASFEACGFPVRMESIMDLRPILDSMQDNAWEKMHRELGGLSERDVSDLVVVLRSWQEFATLNFGIRDGRLPFNAMIAHLALYRKLCRYPFKNILEIGPGVGYLSFFMQHDKGLNTYHQIENTESFYVLQSLVNRHCFGTSHFEQATGDWICGLDDCVHWPWWKRERIGEWRFDLITSNANFAEFSIQARTDYMELIDKTLTPNGVLFFQGYGQNQTNSGNPPPEYLEEKIARYGFVKHEVECAGQTMHINSVWTRTGVALPGIAWDHSPRRTYTKEEIAARVAGEIAAVADVA